MPDVIDIATSAVLVYMGAAGLKVAMAPADALAQEWSTRIRERLGTVHRKAEAKAPDGLLRPPDRIAFKALTEAAITDDEIAGEYLAGVLAASGPHNDDGTPIIAQIGRLSSYQLLFHYVIYRELHRLWPRSSPLNLYDAVQANQAGIRFPIQDVIAALGTDGEFSSLIPTLYREGLIAGNCAWGPEPAADPGSPWTVRLCASPLGAELFLWGHGIRNIDANALLTSDLDLTFLTEVPPTPGASLITPPPPPAPAPE